MEPVASASQPIESASADENGAIAIIEDSEPIVKKSRKTYSVQFKMNALEKLKQVRANGENDADFAANLGVDKSILSRWKKDEKKIAEAAAKDHLKRLGKIRKSTKHNELFRILHEYIKWMDDDDNLELWNNSKALSSKQRRILVTQWVGKAYNKIHANDSEYKDSCRRYFEKTGCLITADGTDDDKITPEGLNDYTIPGPAMYLDAPVDVVPCETPAPAEAVDDENTDLTDEPEDATIDEREDCSDDRDMEHPSVGRMVKALYDNGWHIGEVKYYNRTLKELKVDFPDGSCDYIAPGDIGDTEVFYV